MQNVKINSLKELQLQMPRLLQQFGANQEITSIALANPITALEKAGVSLSAEAKKEIELHVRFGKNKNDFITLQKEMEETAGKNFDPYNKEAVADLILKATYKTDSVATANKKVKTSTTLTRDTVLSILNKDPELIGNKIKDPLKEFSQIHPVIPLLIKLREMDVLYPRFANAADISKIQQSIQKSPLAKVTFRLSRK